MHRIFQKTKEKRALLETEAKELLKEYGISVPDYKLVKKKDDLGRLSGEIRFPIVMKIVSPDIIHKSESGGVKVGLKDQQEAELAYQEIMNNVKKYNHQARIEGVIIYSFIPKQTEIIIGMIKDPHFGPVIMFGLGGVYVEVLKDVSFRILPLKERDAQEMITEIKGFEILKGMRGEPPKDIKAIKDVLMKISHLVEENPEIEELDLNPVFVFEKGLQVIDARIIL